MQRPDAWNQKIGVPLHGRRSWKALYRPSNWALWNCKVKRAIWVTDNGIVLAANLVEIEIIYPNVLSELELPNEASAGYKGRNPALYSVLRRPSGKGGRMSCDGVVRRT
jgi:hypothetical protein